MRHHCLRAALALWMATAAPLALAHDTWFQRLPDAAPGQVAFALGTGNQFPLQEYSLTADNVERSGCRAEGAGEVPLEPLQPTPTALLVQAVLPAAPAVSCWAQLIPLAIELPPDKIAVYLKEINATAAVRAAWAAMQARGLPWKERYTKNARIELAGSVPAAVAPPAAPVGLGLDVLLESGLQRIIAGDTLRFQVLRDGVPLADFPVELRGDRSRFGLWRQTDAQGRVQFPAPLPGRWILRGTELRLSDAEPDLWLSRFVTLAFEIHP